MPSREEIDRERCRRDVSRFISRCSIQVESGSWVPFILWPEQQRTVRESLPHRLLVWLKARQLGMTWLALAIGLHEIVFRPGVTLLLFSLREEESFELLARLRGMYQRLPEHLQAQRVTSAARGEKDRSSEWVLPNGSRAKAFPANRGDSYTAAMAIVDEADLIADLGDLLGSVKPTIDAGGRLLMLSRSDKSRPSSAFKRIYRAAALGQNEWHAVFLPWHARPGRTPEWYESQRRDTLANTGTLDGLHEQYPATDEEALAPRSLDKRLAPEWVRQCYQARQPIPADMLPFAAPAIAGLEVYTVPQKGKRYVIGADPAEGNPTSDDSALTILDADTGEEVCVLAGKLQPAVFAAHIVTLANWYNRAGALVERNNHGHAVLLALAGLVRLLDGHDGRPGWLSSAKGKALLYGTCADAFRCKDTILHSFASMTQLQSIEGSTLRAPQGEHDDRADSYALACVAATKARPLLWDATQPEEARSMMSEAEEAGVFLR